MTYNTTKEYRKIWSVLIHMERYTQDTKRVGNLPIIKGEYYANVNEALIFTIRVEYKKVRQPYAGGLFLSFLFF